MSLPLPFASLASIDALVIDTETTGLDARAARIVQFAAVGIAKGKIDAAETVDQLIDPTIDIPIVATRIHGIAREHVEGQPTFQAWAPTLGRRLAGRLLIGHSIAYDLAILQSEHSLASHDWQPPRALDIRTLARIVAPGLADHGLDRLCDWLGVVNARRHSALGDAMATAEVFVKLVPLLRQKGIRTLAEAEKACVGLAEADARTSGGLMAIDATPHATEAALARLDVFAYRHRVRDVMTSPPATVGATATVGEAVERILHGGLSSVFVEMRSGRFGIFTERDALRALHGDAGAAMRRPVADVAKHPLQSVSEDEHVYRAIGRMERLGFRHLGVCDRTGRLVGALTPRNLLRNRATAAIAIGDGIAAAQNSAQLAATWNEVPLMALNLLREGVDARTIAGVVSAEIRATTQRAAELAEDEMERQGHGRAPCRYAVLVLGSAGRGESLLAADQDNAVVFEGGEPGGGEDAWFAQMATIMADTLHVAGVELCKGGVMAKNSEWRASAADWRQRVATWITRHKPQDLLNVDIFFDAEVVAGDRDLGESLLRQARGMAQQSPEFLKMLTEMARQWQSPVGLLGGFHKTDGRVDLKKGGLLPLFTAARVLALRHGIAEVATEARLLGVLRAGIGSPETMSRILDAHEVLMRAVLRQQLTDSQNGVALSPRVEIDRLDKAERRRIKTALEAVPDLIDLVSEGRL